MHRVMGHISLCYIECAKLLIKEYALKNQYVLLFNVGKRRYRVQNYNNFATYANKKR